jgi:hypothetical protein
MIGNIAVVIAYSTTLSRHGLTGLEYPRPRMDHDGVSFVSTKANPEMEACRGPFSSPVLLLPGVIRQADSSNGISIGARKAQ